MTWRTIFSARESQPIVERAEERARGKLIRTTLCPPSTTTKLHTPADEPVVVGRSEPVAVVRPTQQPTIRDDAMSVSPLISPNSYTSNSSTLETQRSLALASSLHLRERPKTPTTVPTDEAEEKQDQKVVGIDARASGDTGDLSRFIRGQVERAIQDGILLSGSITSDELRDLTCAAVCDGCKGNRQLAQVQISYICGLSTEVDVQNSLQALPQDLNSAYELIYSRTVEKDDIDSQIALNAVRWLLEACGPLPAQILLEAVMATVSDNGEWTFNGAATQEGLLRTWHNLLTFDDRQQSIRFTHPSTIDFFKSKMREEDNHIMISSVCLSLLCAPQSEWSKFYDISEIEENYDECNYSLSSGYTSGGPTARTNLLTYAALFWPQHLAHCMHVEGNAALDALLQRFLNEEQISKRWCSYVERCPAVEYLWTRRSDESASYADRMREFHQIDSECHPAQAAISVFKLHHKFEAAMFKLCSEDLLSQLLGIACRFGDTEMARHLIEETHVCVDMGILSMKNNTPLHIAISHGNDEIVQMLLKHGNAVVNKCNQARFTPLDMAARGWNTALMKRLLEAGADPSAGGSHRKPVKTVLHQAVARSDEEMVRLFLEYHANANVPAKHKEGWTPLHFAVNLAVLNVPIITLLLEAGANPHIHDDKGLMPIDHLVRHLKAKHIHADEKSDEVIKLFIQHGCEINRADGEGWTALHHATNNKRLDLVKWLLEYGADVNVADAMSITPLHLAVARASPAHVHLLLLNGADVKKTDEYGTTALHLAASGDALMNLELLLAKGADIHKIDSSGHTALHYAAGAGVLKNAQLLLARGAKINQADDSGWTVLHHAVNSEHLTTVDFLLAKGADLNCATRNGLTALHFAAHDSRYAIAQSLLSYGADVHRGDNIGLTPLHQAATGGARIVGLLLDRGADIHRTGQRGKTVLHYAVHSKEPASVVATVTLLVSRGANVNKPDADGWTALHHSVRRGGGEAVETLVALGAHIDHPVRGSRSTALHYAAGLGDARTVARLLDCGADIHRTDFLGRTALHLAAAGGYTETVEVLVGRHADLQRVDRMGFTALSVAHREMCKAEKAGGRLRQSERGAFGYEIVRVVRVLAERDPGGLRGLSANREGEEDEAPFVGYSSASSSAMF